MVCLEAAGSKGVVQCLEAAGVGEGVPCLGAPRNGLQVQEVETAGRSQQEQRLEADGSVQEVQWLQAADTKQRMGCLETAGEAWQRTKVTTTSQLMVAAAEVPMEGQEAGVKEGGGQLLLGAAAWVQPVQLAGAARGVASGSQH